MSSKSILPKLEPLTAHRTQIQFENFRQNLLFQLSDHSRFKELLADTKLCWVPTSEDAHRGFEDDSSVLLDRQTAVQKCSALNFMLGTIATYIPVVSRNFIVNQARSLGEIWNRLRVFYGFRKTGALVLDLANFSLDSGESYEMLWERMYSFTEDCLLTTGDNLTHDGSKPSSDESMSPTLLNFLVVIWLKTIHPELPNTIKQRFPTDLQSTTIYSLRETISSSLPSIICDLQNAFVAASASNQRNRNQNPRGTITMPRASFQKSCPLCKAEHRPHNNHYLSGCDFLPEADKKYMNSRNGRSRFVEAESADILDTDHDETQSPDQIYQVSVQRSPTLTLQYIDSTIDVVLDSGAETNLISFKEAKRLKIPIVYSHQSATQADGTPLQIIGETSFPMKWKHHEFCYNGLVVKDLGCPVLAGVPFHIANDVYVRMSTQKIYMGNCCTHDYSPRPPRVPLPRSSAILRSECQTTILPGESISYTIPPDFRTADPIAIEPRLQSPSFAECTTPWLQPSIQQASLGTVILVNQSSQPVRLARSEHICNIRRTEVMPISDPATSQQLYTSPDSSTIPSAPLQGGFFTDAIQVDPSGLLTENMRLRFQEINHRHDDVFDPQLGLYNGASGKFQAIVNMGPDLPPQRKGRCPQYSHADKNLLQQKFDELESHGVFVAPEELNITAEYLNPSFLVRKGSAITNSTNLCDYRLVTSFGEVAKYSKPQPSLLPNVEETIRSIGQWKYLVKSDLTSAYYQIPLSPSSYKFCGVSTPFRGVRVYRRSAMGMPGSETALEQLMCKILGSLIADGHVAKIADDLYCGADTPEQTAEVWESVLSVLSANGLRLAARKTVCCPASTTILGWIWNNGILTASPHRISALESCQLPDNVKGLRSFIGAFKFLAKVLPSYSDVLDPLESAVGGQESKTKLVWTDELKKAFTDAQLHLTKAKSVTIPRKDDELQIITDASVSKLGLAASLFVVRDGHPKLAGFFNAKLKSHQTRWLPCELEALCIGSAVKHFAPYISQSTHRTSVLTDSKPCVQAYDKLCRGEFSASAKVMTFLSILSDYAIKLAHIRGVDNLTADYTSRNPIECSDSLCQICKFINISENSAVYVTQFHDLDGHSLDMFTNRNAWNNIQRSCSDLKRVHAYKRAGTAPTRKARNVTDIRRYLEQARIAQDGLLVVDSIDPLQPRRERIIVPRGVAHGVVTALHIKLSHPSRLQLRRYLDRNFFLLNRDDVIQRVWENCDVCAGLQNVPTRLTEQSTHPPPDIIGAEFSADVVRRAQQCILVVREDSSAFTTTQLITNETANSLRDGLIVTTSILRPNSGHKINIRVDPAPGFRSLALDKSLDKHGILLTLGDEKNVNKNPISEHAIRELHAQLVRIQPNGGPVTAANLAIATSNVNAQLRNCGLSAHEIWTKRDQFSGTQLPVDDRTVIQQRHEQRLRSHAPSAKYKARGLTTPLDPQVQVGSLVYIHQDRDKTKLRDRYLVIAINPPYCTVQKFLGNNIRARQYRVHLSDCSVVRSSIITLDLPDSDSDSENDSDDALPRNEYIRPRDENDNEADDANDHDSDPEAQELEDQPLIHELDPPQFVEPMMPNLRPKRV